MSTPADVVRVERCGNEEPHLAHPWPLTSRVWCEGVPAAVSRPSHVPTVDEVESIGWIQLAHLVDTHLPEPWPRMGCWRATARFLWLIDYRYMADLTAEMRRQGGWIRNPVPVHGGYTQDATHRVVAALGLGWWARPIPVVAIIKELP